MKEIYFEDDIDIKFTQNAWMMIVCPRCSEHIFVKDVTECPNCEMVFEIVMYLTIKYQ